MPVLLTLGKVVFKAASLNFPVNEGSQARTPVSASNGTSKRLIITDGEGRKDGVEVEDVDRDNEHLARKYGSYVLGHDTAFAL